MWRTEKHKLILRLNRKTNANEYDKSDIIGGEFYALKADPQEWNNRYNAKVFEIQQAKMANELMDHLKSLAKLNPQSIHQKITL